MNSLAQLRKEAGFSSAREFAEEMGLPPSSYHRYEAEPEKIPLKAAWALADRLHASIDYIVGRTEVDPVDNKGDIQCAYDALDPRLQQTFKDFLDYLIERNVELRENRISKERRRYDAACYRLEQTFFAEVDENGDLLFEEPAKLRSMFEAYVTKRASSKNSGDTQSAIEQIMDAYDRAHEAENPDEKGSRLYDLTDIE